MDDRSISWGKEADGGRCGSDVDLPVDDRAVVEDAGEGTQQGGLADPVRPDDTDPTTRGQVEFGVGDDRANTALDGELMGDERSRHEDPSWIERTDTWTSVLVHHTRQ